MGPESGRLSESLSTAEHKNIANTVDMLLHLDRLKRGGMSLDEVAEAMAESRFQPPGGGQWTGEIVAKVTGLVGSKAGDRAPQQLQSIPQAPPAPAPVHHRVPEAHLASPLSAQRTRSGDEDIALGLGGPPLAARSGDSGRYQDGYDYDIGPLPRMEAGSAFPGSRLFGMLLISLILVAVGAFAVVALSERGSNDSAAPAAGVDDAAPEGDASSDGATPTTIDGPPTVPATDETTDPADMMSIRVEPDAAAPAGDGTGIPAATATVKADGLLHLEGAFPSQDEADGYIDGLAEVFAGTTSSRRIRSIKAPRCRPSQTSRSTSPCCSSPAPPISTPPTFHSSKPAVTC